EGGARRDFARAPAVRPRRPALARAFRARRARRRGALRRSRARPPRAAGQREREGGRRSRRRRPERGGQGRRDLGGTQLPRRRLVPPRGRPRRLPGPCADRARRRPGPVAARARPRGRRRRRGARSRGPRARLGGHRGGRAQARPDSRDLRSGSYGPARLGPPTLVGAFPDRHNRNVKTKRLSKPLAGLLSGLFVLSSAASAQVRVAPVEAPVGASALGVIGTAPAIQTLGAAPSLTAAPILAAPSILSAPSAVPALAPAAALAAAPAAAPASEKLWSGGMPDSDAQRLLNKAHWETTKFFLTSRVRLLRDFIE